MQPRAEAKYIWAMPRQEKGRMKGKDLVFERILLFSPRPTVEKKQLTDNERIG